MKVEIRNGRDALNTKAKSRVNGFLAVRTLTGLGLILTGMIAHGAWVVEPSASVGTSYDDNVRLNPQNEEDAIITNAELQARVRRLTETTEIAALASANVFKYSKVDTINDDLRETAFVELSANRRFQRSSISMRGSYRRQDLLRNTAIIDDGQSSSDQADADSGGAPDTDLADDILTGADPDSGSVEQQVTRNTIRAQPNVNYQLSERTSVDLGYSFVDTSYDESGPSTVNTQDDYKTHTGSLRLQRQMSLSDTAWLEVARTWYQPDGLFNPDTDSWNATLGWRRQVSERMNVAVSAGGRRTDSDFSGTDTGFLLNARIDRRTERGRLFTIVSRTFQPNAYGEEVQLDRLRVGFNQGISDRMSWTLSGNLFSTDDSSSGSGNRDQDYANVSASLQRAFTQAWSVRGTYSYTWVDRKRDDGSATRNSVGLSLVYTPPRRL
jgi:hypothetical protein